MTTYPEFEEEDRQRKLRFERWLKKWPLRVPGPFDMERDEIREMHDWLDEQCVGKWSIRAERVEIEGSEDGKFRRRPMIRFKSEDDAFAFKIRWA